MTGSVVRVVVPAPVDERMDPGAPGDLGGDGIAEVAPGLSALKPMICRHGGPPISCMSRWSLTSPWRAGRICGCRRAGGATDCSSSHGFYGPRAKSRSQRREPSVMLAAFCCSAMLRHEPHPMFAQQRQHEIPDQHPSLGLLTVGGHVQHGVRSRSMPCMDGSVGMREVGGGVVAQAPVEPVAGGVLGIVLVDLEGDLAPVGRDSAGRGHRQAL